ncbi:RloB family protein [uncultured Duncaniella sp.]|uniref:RloB family protein n=1 Tax=uncultured Duncaniella sp. TaxID=2768039 RepID=UPI0025AA0161|nr:RloB family protein [uncultured Duncaniella sp.]
MITRRKDYSKQAPSRNASKIYIVCEGAETEKNYFGFFEGLSSNLELIVIPPEEGTDPLKLMELAHRELLDETRTHTLDFMQNDKVWFAIDTDTWEDEGKIQPLRDFCAYQNSHISDKYDEVKPYPAWCVAQSNPCFEIWLYYHLYDTVPDIEDIKRHPSVKAFVNHCIAGGFDYQKDQARLKDAIENAEKVFSRKDNGNPELFSTEQYLLGKEIYGFVNTELQKLRNKLG